MLSHTSWPWQGSVDVLVRRHAADCPAVLQLGPCLCRPGVYDGEHIKNLIVTAGKNLARDILRGQLVDASIRFCALGTSATAPAATDTQLVAEAFRKAVTRQAAGAAGESVVTTYIAPAEGVFSIQELGFFASPTATAAANSGVLIARVLYARVKTGLESLDIVRHDQF